MSHPMPSELSQNEKRIQELSQENAGRKRKVKNILGELPITEKKKKKLSIKHRTQMSPMLEKNCLLLSGDESYEKSAKKIKSLTGIAVSHSTQQRLVHRYHFEELPSNTEVEEM